MPIFKSSVIINAPIEQVFHFHDDTNNLLKITPPDTKVELISSTPPGKGQRAIIAVTQFGFFKSKWEVEITEYQAPNKIIDKQLHGPFGKWEQTRNFKKLSESQTEMTDEVSYELPIHAITDFFAKSLVKKEVEKMFAYRHKKTKELLESAQK